MPISVEEALSSYGFVFRLAESIPELKGFLDQAIQGGWTQQKLTASIESSPWWMQNADTVRNLAVMQATDPKTYEQNVANAGNLVFLKAMQLGRAMDLPTAHRLALRTLAENASWDDQRLTFEIVRATAVNHGEGGTYTGQAAQLGEHMTQVARNFGVAYTADWLDQWVTDVAMGANSLDGFEAVVRSRAKAAYPHFGAQIDAGMTIRDIADPYISTYAQTLEVPETEVNLDDTYIKQALSQSGPDGTTRTAMPLWQFQRQLKSDVRYDKTSQAKNDAFSALAQIGRDWGFVGGGS